MAINYRELLDSSAFTRQQAETLVALLDAAVAQAVSEVAPPELVTGSLVQGSGVSLTGTLADRLVGTGDVTIALAGPTEPWTYVKLDTNFSVSSGTQTASPLGFTPELGVQYLFESMIYIATNASSVSPRAGIIWPAASANMKSAGLVTYPVGLIPPVISDTVVDTLPRQSVSTTSTGSNIRAICRAFGMFTANASILNDFAISLATEVPPNTVRFEAGSYLRYRTLP